MPIAPLWLVHALAYRGQREVPGAGSNPVILRWAVGFGGWIKSFFTDDDTPWCALFVNECLKEAGLSGTNSLAASSFQTWGQPLSQPTLGAIMTFVRPGGHHVGFYLGERKDGALRIFGGNQNNEVDAIWMPVERLTSVRWPSTELLPSTGRVALATTGEPMSSNEA